MYPDEAFFVFAQKHIIFINDSKCKKFSISFSCMLFIYSSKDMKNSGCNNSLFFLLKWDSSKGYIEKVKGASILSKQITLLY